MISDENRNVVRAGVKNVISHITESEKDKSEVMKLIYDTSFIMLLIHCLALVIPAGLICWFFGQNWMTVYVGVFAMYAVKSKLDYYDVFAKKCADEALPESSDVKKEDSSITNA